MSVSLSQQSMSTFGPAAYRPQQFVLVLIDASTSMQGAKIQALNFAMAESLAELQDEAAKNEFCELIIQVICFSDGARATTRDAITVDQFTWSDVTAYGSTDMGKALSLSASCLDAANLGQQGCPPVICLLSDGQATDDYRKGLAALNANPWGKKAARIAIAVGQDADRTVLSEIVGNSERGIVLEVANASQMVDAISKGTVAASRITSRPVSSTCNRSMFASLLETESEDATDVPDSARPDNFEDLEAEVW